STDCEAVPDSSTLRDCGSAGAGRGGESRWTAGLGFEDAEQDRAATAELDIAKTNPPGPVYSPGCVHSGSGHRSNYCGLHCRESGGFESPSYSEPDRIVMLSSVP